MYKRQHLGGLKMAKEYVHRAADGRRYLCVHGDGFDAISTNHRWLAMLGSCLLYTSRCV